MEVSENEPPKLRVAFFMADENSIPTTSEPVSKTENTKQETTDQLGTIRESPITPLDDINYHRMADTLDVSYEDRKISHIQEKIAFLTDWAKQETKSDDRLTQALAIKDLCKRLGFNLTGKEMITKLHKWTYLDLARKRIELQQSLL